MYGPRIDSNPDYADSDYYLHTAEQLVKHWQRWAKDVPNGRAYDQRSWIFWHAEQGWCEETSRYAAGSGQAVVMALSEAGLPPHHPGRREVLRRVERPIARRPIRSSAGEPFTVEHFERWAGELILEG